MFHASCHFFILLPFTHTHTPMHSNNIFPLHLYSGVWLARSSASVFKAKHLKSNRMLGREFLSEIPWYWVVALIMKLAICLWSEALVAGIDHWMLGRLTRQVQDALLLPPKVWDAGKAEGALLSICQALPPHPTLGLFSYCAIAGHNVARSEGKWYKPWDFEQYILGHSSEDVQLVDLVVQVVLPNLFWSLLLLQRLATKPFEKDLKIESEKLAAPVPSPYKGGHNRVVVFSAGFHLNTVKAFIRKVICKVCIFVQLWLTHSCDMCCGFFKEIVHHAGHVFHVLLSSKHLHLIFTKKFSSWYSWPPGGRSWQGSHPGCPVHFAQPKFQLSWKTKVKYFAIFHLGIDSKLTRHSQIFLNCLFNYHLKYWITM